MMRGNVTITVSGHAATGKSALAQEIAAALRSCGFPVQYENPEHPPRNREAQMKIIEATKARLIEEGSVIVVNEQHARRGSLESVGGFLAGQIAVMTGATPSRTRYEFKKPDDSEGGHHD